MLVLYNFYVWRVTSVSLSLSIFEAIFIVLRLISLFVKSNAIYLSNHMRELKRVFRRGEQGVEFIY